MNNGETRNPLVRDGIAQPQRQLVALSTDFVQVDEQDLADFLVFAYELSQRLTYYNNQNQPEGDWHDFLERSTPIQIACISKTRPDTIQDAYNLALKQFLAQWAITPASPASTHRFDKLESVLKIYAEILATLLTWDQGLADGTPLKTTIRASINADVLRPLQQLSQIGQGLPQGDRSFQQDIRAFAEHFGVESLLQESGLNPLGDRSMALALRQITTNRVQAQAELNGIFQPLFQTYSRIIQAAPGALQQSLFVDQSLSPHLALLVAFWQVLQPARLDLNRITQRHLDFFYRTVLRLSERPAQPDRAYVILELAKFQLTYQLERQTRFSAGTDATGVDLLYSLGEAVVVNTAQVAELKGLFLHSRVAPDASENHLGREILGLHASPVANSVDGVGGAFPKDQTVPAWLPFGDPTRPVAEIGLAIASNILLLQEGDRTITFTLALFFPLGPASAQLEAKLSQTLRLELSGETGWISISPTREPVEDNKLEDNKPEDNKPEDNKPSATLSFKASSGSITDYLLTIKVHLPVNVEAVLPYRLDLPGGRLNTNRPVARLILRHQTPENTNLSEAVPPAAEPSVYHDLYEARLKTVTITTAVKGVRNLLLQNDLATLDATKPFLPFGIQPKAGANFYIGNPEVFQKPLTDLKLFFDLETPPPASRAAQTEPQGTDPDWQQIYAAYGIPDNFKPGQLTIHVLRDRQWQSITSVDQDNLFYRKHPSDHPQYGIDLKDRLDHFRKLDNSSSATGLEPWNYQSQSGFLRWQLTGDDFRHAEYPSVLARQVLATATQESIEVEGKKRRRAVIGAYYRSHPSLEIHRAETYFVELTDEPILPGEPYTPVVKSLQLDYAASVTDEVGTAGQDCQLFHLYPFDGVGSFAHPSSESGPLMFCLPQFVYEGELLIGLQNLEPSTTLSLLFQVAEESANTDLKKVDVFWSYLQDNTWKPFDNFQSIQDTSNGLIHSGIVKLAIPADISNAHTTILNPALHWIKASISSRQDEPVYQAICRIISIQTQAAEVTFVDQGNDPNHLATPLPAASLTKLANPQLEIKQVRHPFPSFGGKLKEQPAHFYMRVSEHLRHKGRAITIFDYERLVLERFPEIYKVRCINHGQIADDGHLQEIAPGSVTLVVIPTLVQQRTINDLKLKVNINLLVDIEQYLQSLSSSWVKIRAVNPIYEEIAVEFQVQFRQPFQADFSFYQQELERAIIGFLSPWVIDGGEEIHFDQEIYPSAILNFIEERPYVDYVLDFHLYQTDPQGQRQEVSKAVANTAQSILVSVGPGGHSIREVPEELILNRGETTRGLGYDLLETLLQ